MKKHLYPVAVSAFIALCVVLTSCHDEDEEEQTTSSTSKLNPYVVKEAGPVLDAESILSLFSVTTFSEDSADVTQDLMELHFDQFSPSMSKIEPDPDKDQTTNDLGWTRSNWKEVGTVDWLVDSHPETQNPFNLSRSYRVLNNNTLSAPKTVLNRPTYERIDDNIYERHLGATFVWDMGNGTLSNGTVLHATVNVSNDDIADYANIINPYTNTTLTFLELANIWGVNNNASSGKFSNGAKVYGASRSIAEDSYIIEAVLSGGSYSLTPTRFGLGNASITDALAAYPHTGTARLEYRFSVNYSLEQSIFLAFDTANSTVYIHSSSTSTDLLTATYILDTANSMLEIAMDSLINVNDTSQSLEASRQYLGIPAYFNPIIAGPFTTDGSNSSDITIKSYYYGKHYIKTNKDNRKDVDALFFLNGIARDDIKKVFKGWREKRQLEGP